MLLQNTEEFKSQHGRRYEVLLVGPFLVPYLLVEISGGSWWVP